MKARLLKKWGANYAGQVLSNVDKGSIPAGVAEFYEDDDAAVNTVVAQEDVSDPLAVINDEINPESAKAHDEAQRALADDSNSAVDRSALADALAEQERKDTQERAHHADDVAAGRRAKGEAALTASQKESLKAGKGPADANKGRAPKAPKAAKAGKGRGRK